MEIETIRSESLHNDGNDDVEINYWNDGFVDISVNCYSGQHFENLESFKKYVRQLNDFLREVE